MHDNLIENLYVRPDQQRKGHGTKLLQFALSKCKGTPELWILENNVKARGLYEMHGFRETGERHQLSDWLGEVEMKLQKNRIKEDNE